jgi:FkbM family methyltransferase
VGASVYCFEPVRANYERLKEHVDSNGLVESVSVENCALGDHEGEIEMSVERKNGAMTGNAVFRNANASGQAEVAILTTLDSEAARLGLESCDLIKMDVEGAELMVLRGGSGFLPRARPVIYGEFNRYWMSRFGHTFLDVVELVRPWGYSIYRTTHAGFTKVEDPQEGNEDMLLLPHDAAHDVMRSLGIGAD